MTEETQDKEKQQRDPLLDALVAVTKENGDERSAESLTYGLAIDGKMTPELFIEAAKRAGYRAKIIKTELKDIDAAVLPIVIILNDDNAAVASNAADLEKHKNDYSGYCLYIRKKEAVTKDTTGHSHIDLKKEHWFWSVIRGNYKSYGLAMFAAVFVNLFALAGPLYIMNVYDRVLPNSAFETGWVLGIAVLIVYVFDLVIRTLRTYFIDLASRRADVILARKLMDHILDMKLLTHDTSINATANALREFDMLREFMTSATMIALVDVPFSLLFIFVIWIIGGPIALMLVGIFLFVVIGSILIQVPVKALIYKSMKGNEIKHNLLLETLYNLETVKGVGGAGRLRKKYTDVVGEAALYSQQSKLWSGFALNFTAFAQQATSVFIVLIGMYLVADGALSVGGLIACVILSTRALAPIAQITGLISKYFHASMALNSLNKVMSAPVEREAGRRYLSRPTLKGDFELRGVSYAYPNTNEPVVQNINLNVKAGDKIGIVGKIGSGKSTLIKLMMHFYDANAGTIKLDETDIRQIDPADLRKNIAYVSQDPGLFRGTVRENIALANPKAGDGAILRASKLAGVHSFIGATRQGYDSLIGDNGEGFSGGQKQAIAMARAFLVDADIMICDEPTNAMDMQSEQELIAALKQHTKDKTLILVTHRQQMLELVDRIMVMQGGQIVAEGPRDKMLAFLAKGATPAAAAEINKSGGKDGKK